MTKRIFIGLAAAVLGVVALRVLMREPGAPDRPTVPPDTIAQIKDRGPESTVRARLFEIGNSDLLNDEETAFVLQAARDPVPLVRAAGGKTTGDRRDQIESRITQRTALAIISSCLVDESVDVETRKTFTDTIIAALSDEHPGIRHTAIACATESGLLQLPEVRQRVANLREDPHSKVANLALRVLGE